MIRCISCCLYNVQDFVVLRVQPNQTIILGAGKIVLQHLSEGAYSTWQAAERQREKGGLAFVCQIKPFWEHRYSNQKIRSPGHRDTSREETWWCQDMAVMQVMLVCWLGGGFGCSQAFPCSHRNYFTHNFKIHHTWLYRKFHSGHSRHNEDVPK